jgi:hypothetical protein
MIKVYFLLIVSVLVFGKISQVEAQMVSVRMILPAGVNFNPRIIMNQPKEGETGLRWAEMVVQENIHVTVSLKADDSGLGLKEPLYVVNNGTADFGRASKYESGKTSFQLDHRGLLIRNIRPQVQQVRAWLGIPVLPGIVTVIEYH